MIKFEVISLVPYGLLLIELRKDTGSINMLHVRIWFILNFEWVWCFLFVFDNQKTCSKIICLVLNFKRSMPIEYPNKRMSWERTSKINIELLILLSQTNWVRVWQTFGSEDWLTYKGTKPQVPIALEYLIMCTLPISNKKLPSGHCVVFKRTSRVGRGAATIVEK